MCKAMGLDCLFQFVCILRHLIIGWLGLIKITDIYAVV